MRYNIVYYNRIISSIKMIEEIKRVFKAHTKDLAVLSAFIIVIIIVVIGIVFGAVKPLQISLNKCKTKLKKLQAGQVVKRLSAVSSKSS